MCASIKFTKFIGFKIIHKNSVTELKRKFVSKINAYQTGL